MSPTCGWRFPTRQSADWSLKRPELPLVPVGRRRLRWSLHDFGERDQSLFSDRRDLCCCHACRGCVIKFSRELSANCTRGIVRFSATFAPLDSSQLLEITFPATFDSFRAHQLFDHSSTHRKPEIFRCAVNCAVAEYAYLPASGQA